MSGYKIIRMYRDHSNQAHCIKFGLSKDAAQAHCNDPETSSSTCTSEAGNQLTDEMGPWFDGYEYSS